MPELPEVENVRIGLEKFTTGQLIINGAVLLPRTLAYPFSVEEFIEGLQGNVIQGWQRRGKYLLAPLSSGYLGVHLRMSGQLLWVKQDSLLQKHTRVRLFFADNQELRFVDTRTFGKFWWIPPHSNPETIITGLKKLGPEPFSLEFNPAYLALKLAKSNRPIKNVLLDQSLVAGIGNIYADEALFVSGILPTKKAADLTSKEIERLYLAIIEVLNLAISKGGTSFSDYLNLLGVNGNYGGIAWVYGRKAQLCRRCHSKIEQTRLAGRSAHFCPVCQT